MENYQEVIEGLAIPTRKAMHRLECLQDTPGGWELGIQLLNSENDNCKFYGALTLKHKITRHWKDLKKDEEKKNNIKNFLLSKVELFTLQPNIPDMVLIKLLATLINMIFQEEGTSLLDSLNAVISGFDQLYPQNPLRVESIKLKYLSLLPEEYIALSRHGVDKNHIKIALAKGGRDVALEVIEKYIKITNQQLDPVMEQLRICSLDCLFNWVDYGIPSLELPGIVDVILTNFPFENTFSKCVDILVEILNHKNATKVEDTLYKKFFELLISQYMQNQVQFGLQNKEHDLSKALLKLYSNFGESYLKRILEDMKNLPLGCEAPQSILFRVIMALTNYPGTYGYDQEVTEESFEFWQLLCDETQELFYDNQTAPTDSYDLHSEIMQQFTNLVNTLLMKISFPSEEDLQTWDDDISKSFKGFRFNAGTILSDLYFILKVPFVSHYIGHAEQLITTLKNMKKPLPNCWQELDSILYFLQKVSSQTLALELVPSILHLFSSDFMGAVLDNGPESSTHFKNQYIKSQALSTTASFVNYYKSNTQILRQITDKVVKCFNDQSILEPATFAFRDICDNASKELSDDGDALTESLSGYLLLLKDRDLEIMLQSLSSIVASSQQSSLMPHRIEKLTDHIVDRITNLSELYVNSQDANIFEEIGKNFKFLAATCSGIRNSSYVTDVEEPNFPNPAPITFTEKVFTVTSRVLEMFGKQDIISLQVSNFLNEGLKTLQIPCPFCFPFEALIQLMTQVYVHHPHANYLTVASQLAITYCSKTSFQSTEVDLKYFQVLSSFSISVISTTSSLLENAQDIEKFQDIIRCFCDFLGKLLKHSPHSFYIVPDEIMIATLRCIIIGLSSQDRSVTKALSAVMIEIFLFEVREKIYAKELQVEYEPKLRRIMNQGFGYHTLEKILFCAGGGLPRSYVKTLSEPFRKFLNVHKEECKPWLTDLMARDGFPTHHIELHVKQRFMVEFVKASINSMKFQNILEYFSEMCWNVTGKQFKEYIFQ